MPQPSSAAPSVSQGATDAMPADPHATAAAKSFGHVACDALKGKTCKLPQTLIVMGGVADFRVKIEGDAPTSLRVAARYPLAVMVAVTGDPSSDAARRALDSLKLPADGETP
ncbi:MAG TPA: hypothetical protein VIF15_05705 [Polyangiaceae bacterium]